MKVGIGLGPDLCRSMDESPQWAGSVVRNQGNFTVQEKHSNLRSVPRFREPVEPKLCLKNGPKEPFKNSPLGQKTMGWRLLASFTPKMSGVRASHDPPSPSTLGKTQSLIWRVLAILIPVLRPKSPKHPCLSHLSFRPLKPLVPVP